jgi:hypothetical protein
LTVDAGDGRFSLYDPLDYSTSLVDSGKLIAVLNAHSSGSLKGSRQAEQVVEASRSQVSDLQLTDN